MGAFGDLPPSYYEGLRRDLVVFRAAYIEYLNATLGSVQSGAVPTYDARRTPLQKLAVRASQAVDVTGMRIALTPPPAFGGPILIGVAVIALAHEDARWSNFGSSMSGGHYKTSYELVLETLDSRGTEAMLVQGRGLGRLTRIENGLRLDLMGATIIPRRFVVGLPEPLPFAFLALHRVSSFARTLAPASDMAFVSPLVGTVEMKGGSHAEGKEQ